ncbi:hypothetical protein KSZ_79430 [Dictyobacter formicarum]|uniref:Uncharacterized protein n=1 Tax=Dictyobacter formicarum TaxID=2778368 RepID=A0ABQ3VUH5_9CHLR|nr:hypothetical protein KSZ_79430 [Dictyobacter formicarum]
MNLEQAHNDVVEAVKDINHYVTMMYGVVGKQGVDIRDIKIGVRSIDERLTALDTRLTTLEQNVNSRFDRLEKLLLDRLPPA